MQRKNRIYAALTATALLVWIALGSYWFSDNCCGPDSSTLEEASLGSLLIQDGNALQLTAAKTIAFPINNTRPILHQDVSDQIMTLVRYIKSNPLKKLTIVGLFSGQESAGVTLATSRADSIESLFLKVGTPAYQLSTEAGRRDDLKVDPDNDLIGGAIDFVFECIAPFEVRDDATDFQLDVADNLVFDYDNNEFLLQLSEPMQKAIQDLANYLKEHPQRKLLLTGYNHPDENNGTIFKNLGLARAQKIRQQLLSWGVSAWQVEAEGIAEERLAVLESSLYEQFLPNAMGFAFEATQPNDERQLKREVAKVEAALQEMQVFRFKDFEKNDPKIVINARLQAYLKDLILYISGNEKAKIYCVGHSNYSASEEESAIKGKERATYTKAFLMRHGIPADRIEITTAGASHPLGDESTRYGQQINRRVDLFISYNGEEPQLYVLPPVSPKKDEAEEEKKGSEKEPKENTKPTEKETEEEEKTPTNPAKDSTETSASDTIQ